MSGWHSGVIFGVFLGGVVTLILVGLAVLRAEYTERVREHFDQWERELDQ